MSSKTRLIWFELWSWYERVVWFEYPNCPINSIWSFWISMWFSYFNLIRIYLLWLDFSNLIRVYNQFEHLIWWFDFDANGDSKRDLRQNAYDLISRFFDFILTSEKYTITCELRRVWRPLGEGPKIRPTIGQVVIKMSRSLLIKPWG